mmetsp:Transcript_13752/g.23640  ORF Transcript_13752/g.23640 Transcript_13752/m.23640 type:complete len:257 (+) Transcript_13752:54-824(+)
MQQLCFTPPSGPSFCVTFAHALKASDLKEIVEARYGYPSFEQRFVSSSSEIPDDFEFNADTAANSTFIHILFRLRGGKGGFGSLLRGSSTGVGQKKTSNFDACRDLSGRRLRHINNEKKLGEWMEQKDKDLGTPVNKTVKKPQNARSFDDKKYISESKAAIESVSSAVAMGVKEEMKRKQERDAAKRKALEESTKEKGKKKCVWEVLEDMPEEYSEEGTADDAERDASSSSSSPTCLEGERPHPSAQILEEVATSS